MFAFIYLFSEGENKASSSLKIEYYTFKLYALSFELLCSYAMTLESDYKLTQNLILVIRCNDDDRRQMLPQGSRRLRRGENLCALPRAV